MGLGTGAAMSDPFLEFPAIVFPYAFHLGKNFPSVISYLKPGVRFSHNDPLQTPRALGKEKEEKSYILIHQAAVIMEWGN